MVIEMLKFTPTGTPCRDESDSAACPKKTLHNLGSPNGLGESYLLISERATVAALLSVRRAYADLSA